MTRTTPAWPPAMCADGGPSLDTMARGCTAIQALRDTWLIPPPRALDRPSQTPICDVLVRVIRAESPFWADSLLPTTIYPKVIGREKCEEWDL